MESPPRRRAGAPRSFNRDHAVDIAMRLFRRRGYEGVSVADLTAAIGIAPPSLYAAFGSKAGLYREALDRYAALPGALDGMAGAQTPAQAARELLRAAVRAATSGEKGCMISTGLVEGAVEQQELARELAARRRDLRDRIAGVLERWLPPEDAARRAAFLLAVQQGISVQARDGESADRLMLIAETAVAAMEAEDRRPRATPRSGGRDPGSADEGDGADLPAS
ncbi:TetR/AcrR family transcriptional regulator [Rhizosaccharibacter radicis]|uniref:TetR/AcrR family transcriptional regulator n=1 Tax=Rhizosaccharibacter radicis TaxID=2782605 RepID=A0ABT1W1K4_9PROT|nr:TetR/AcrR family transcriptional regulator [Acetobacteraceae bacterium KSS12]